MSQTKLLQAVREDGALARTLGLPRDIQQEDGSRDQFVGLFHRIAGGDVTAKEISLEQWVAFDGFDWAGSGDSDEESDGKAGSSDEAANRLTRANPDLYGFAYRLAKLLFDRVSAIFPLAPAYGPVPVEVARAANVLQRFCLGRSGKFTLEL